MTLFEEPTVAGLARRIEAARGQEPDRQPIVPIPRADEPDLPMSFAQQRLWFLSLLHPHSAAYNMPAAVELRGELTVALLAAGLTEIVRRHEVLRARFPTVGGRPRLVIAPPTAFSLPCVDLGQLRPDVRRAEVLRLATAEARRPFALAAESLLRVLLVRLDANAHVVLVNMHHIVSDGWSISRFVHELAALYRAGCLGRPSPLPALPIQYADFAAWQQRWLRGETMEAQLAYWKQRLGGTLPALRLPVDFPPPTTDSGAGARLSRVLDPDLVGKLRTLGRERGATLFMLMLAAFKILLARTTGEDDVVVGTPIAGRTRSETEPLIGCFLNTLALRTDLAGNPSFPELLGRVREGVLAAWAHQDVPFEQVVEVVEPDRDLSRNPIFDVMLNYLNLPPAHLDFPGLTATPLELVDPPSKFLFTLYVEDLYVEDLYVEDQPEQVRLRLVYRGDLFSAERMACFLGQYEYLLAQIAAEVRRPICSYSLVAPEFRAALPDPAVPLPTPPYPLVGPMFLEWGARAPELEALRHGDRSLSYGALADRATRLARMLVIDGLEPGEVVAVYGPRSFGLIASMLGVLIGGGVLLNLDPNLPAERLRVMLREAHARRLLAVGDGPPLEGAAAEPAPRTIRVTPADATASAGELAPGWDRTPLPEPDPDGPAYLFFTSGTTGIPKGVLGRHRGLAHFLHWQRDRFAIGPRDRAAQLTALSFDVVLRDILTPLVSGATLCLPEDEDFSPGRIIPWLAQEEVTVMHTVPALARIWLHHLTPGITLPCLRWVFFAGEPLSDELVRRWRRAFPEGEVVNLYGPTETTLAKCCYLVPAEPLPGVQPVGRPLPETQALVLGDGDQPCGISEPGEIILRTPFRSLGYVNSPEDNRLRFFPNPWRDDEADLLYRTGDRGRFRPDGVLEILGRLDHQIKIRGVRVEPSEIESRLAAHPAVREAVVVGRGTVDAGVWLVAYYVPRSDQTATVSELRTYLRQQLPEAMIPAAFVRLERLPLTANGKVDRGALPEPDATRPELDSEFVAPRTVLDQQIAGIWCRLLKLERVGIHDNFFDLGGHSLLLIEMQAQLENLLGHQVPLLDLFRFTTIAGLARHFQQAAQEVNPRLAESRERAAARRASIDLGARRPPRSPLRPAATTRNKR